MNEAENVQGRLRAALSAAGHVLPEGASLLELSVWAARLIKDNAEEIRVRQIRSVSRALPSGDTNDPWRIGAYVKQYDSDVKRWRRVLIVDREVDENGAMRLMLQNQSIRAFKLPIHGFARTGAGGRRYFVPDGTDEQEAVRWFAGDNRAPENDVPHALI